MTTKLRKWGNGYGILIPKYKVEELGAEIGTSFSIEVKDKKMILEKQVKKETITLKSLLAGIKKDNLHEEVNWGYDVEAENW